jgi:hypothetical protein
MEEHLPLSALLSQTLVAFTIEFDNEFEHRVPHRTSDHGAAHGGQDAPWLVSMVMWSRFMRFIPDGGIPVRELQRVLAVDNKSIKALLTRMGQWWGYVSLDPDAVVRATAGGRKALAAWRPLTELIEGRWRRRFGEDTIDRLCDALRGVARQPGVAEAGSLPILGYGLFSNKASPISPSEPSLSGLLSKLLRAFAMEFEQDAAVSLAISANVLRLFGENNILVRDLPRLSGVSKEAIATSISFLAKRGYAQVESAGRTRVLALTQRGRDARDRYHRMVWQIETGWKERMPNASLRKLRDVLEGMSGDPLFRGLEPYPDGWRASIARPTVLPHFPMILHRGGYPDGS